MPIGQTILGEERSEVDRLGQQLESVYRADPRSTSQQEYKSYQIGERGTGSNMWHGAGHGLTKSTESAANFIPDLAGEKDKFFDYADSWIYDNSHQSKAFGITSDIFQAVGGIAMGTPLRRLFLNPAKQLKELRKKELRDQGKRKTITAGRVFDVAKEGALIGGIAETLAFRGQDEQLILDHIFRTDSAAEEAFRLVSETDGWENMPTAEVATRMEQAYMNIKGRAMFAAEGVLLGALCNFVIAAGKAVFRKAVGESDAGLLKSQGDEGGATAADQTAKQSEAQIQGRKQKLEEAEDLANPSNVDEVEAAHKKMVNAEATAQEVEAAASRGGGGVADEATVPNAFDDEIVSATAGPRSGMGSGSGAPQTADSLDPKLFKTKPVPRNQRINHEELNLEGTPISIEGGKVSYNTKGLTGEWNSINANSDSIYGLPKDAFDGPEDWVWYRRIDAEMRLRYPQLVKESDKAYAKRSQRHAVNEMKRRGLGRFYNYEFDAPEKFKHLELTPREVVHVLFKDAVTPKQIKRMTDLLTGKSKGVKFDKVMHEVENLMRHDTSFTSAGMKYFQNRLMRFFMHSMRENIGGLKTKDADTFANAVGYLQNPRGMTLEDVMQEHLLNGVEDLADSYGLSSKSMIHRIMEGRGDAKHLYKSLSDTDTVLEKGATMDVAALKEMNVRVMAYRMEQHISQMNYKRLAEKISGMSEDAINKGTDGKEMLVEMERQQIRSGRIQKLKKGSGDLLRSWHAFKQPLVADGEAARLLAKNGGAKALKRHAQRTQAIYQNAQSKLDGSNAAADHVGKSWSGIDVHNEYWLNSILSGTKTQVVNTISTALHMYYKPMEGILGSMRGDPAARRLFVQSLVQTAVINAQVVRVLGSLVGTNLRHLGGVVDNAGFHAKRKKLFAGGAKGSGTYEQAVGAVAGARKSFRSGQGTLSQGADLFDVVPPRAIHGGMIKGGGMLGPAMTELAQGTLDHVGNAIRLPSRLMIGTDELFKQITFRATAMGKLAADGYDDAIKNGIAPTKQFLSKYVAENFQGLIRQSGRRHTKAAVRDEGIKKAQQTGIEKWSEIEQFAADYTDKHYRDELGILSKYSQDTAEDVTFTRALDKDAKELIEAEKLPAGTTVWMKDVQDTVHRHPWMRMVMPFIKTPVNILAFPLRRMAFLGSPSGKIMGFEFEWLKKMHMRYQADMASNTGDMLVDAARKAEALGRVRAGRFYWMGFTGAAATGIITGGGPSNPRERRSLMSTGWRPYSVKVGDYYISYSRLDPFSTAMGLAADLYEKVSNMGKEGDIEEDWLTAAMMGGAYTISNNIADKSYLAGINNVLQALIDPENKFKALLKKQTSSYVPKIISQWTPITDDHFMKKTYDWKEGMQSRIPGLNAGIEPMRNYLGEALEAMYEPTVWAAGFNPFMISKANHDPVLGELNHVHYGFGAPTPRIKGMRHLDMRKFFNDDGRSAFDRYQALIGEVTLGGKNIREMLSTLFNTKGYTRASLLADQNKLEFAGGPKDPRVKAIKSVMGKYRTYAKLKLLQEYPRMNDAVNSFDRTIATQLQELLQ
jgi:hypothetical protein